MLTMVKTDRKAIEKYCKDMIISYLLLINVFEIIN